MKFKFPQILVSSVDSWSDGVGSDTLTTLLSQFDSARIASINIRAKKSDSKVASRYFHIIEGRVIRSILSHSINTGEEYLIDNKNSESDDADVIIENKVYSRKYKINRWLLVLAREFLWKIGRWRSKELDEFVKTFHPDVFFFPIEGYIHFNRINLFIINKYQPKRVIGYMWDDNFTYKQYPKNLFYLIHRLWLRKSVRQLVQKSNAVFAISPKMKLELDAEYGINSILLTKPVRTITSVPSRINKPIRIIYTGKLGIGRDNTIVNLVDAIKKVNSNGVKIILDLYTGSIIDPKIRSLIDSPGNCNLYGFIPQQEVFKEQEKADILLFVESMSNDDLSARLSFSTKITDYFSAGKCIWAIGNIDLAPIEYLKENDAALVSYSKETIVAVLDRIISDLNIISEYAQKAYKCGIKNHSKEDICTRFRKVVEG